MPYFSPKTREIGHVPGFGMTACSHTTEALPATREPRARLVHSCPCGFRFSARRLGADFPSGIAPALTAGDCVLELYPASPARRLKLPSVQIPARGSCSEHRPICAHKLKPHRSSNHTKVSVSRRSPEPFSPTRTSTTYLACSCCANCNPCVFTPPPRSGEFSWKTTACSACSSARRAS